MLTIPGSGGKAFPKSAYDVGRRAAPEHNLASESAPASLIMVVLAERRRSRCQGTATERSDDYGRSGDPEIFAASLSLPDGGWDSGDRKTETRGRRKARDGH